LRRSLAAARCQGFHVAVTQATCDALIVARRKGNVMLLAKTDKARTALQTRSPALNAMDRRVLIVSDGERSRDALLAMFGNEAAANIERLLRDGYLEAVQRPGMFAQAASGLASMLRSERTDREPVDAPSAAITAVSAPAPKPAVSRRSMAAAKMYLVDMLQLQRNEESASLRAAIHTAPSEDELVWQLCKALRHLRATTTGSYGERVTARLAEILPEPWLPRLQAALSAEAGSAAQSSAA
jgi:hypothetical protein